MDVEAVRQGIMVRLRTIPGLRVSEWIGADMSPPSAAVTLDSIEYGYTKARGKDRAEYAVWVVVADHTSRAAEPALAAFCSSSGASSIVAAIHGDPTLGGMAEHTDVLDGTAGSLDVAATEYLACVFTVEVIA
jgi:hypothetical protein